MATLGTLSRTFTKLVSSFVTDAGQYSSVSESESIIGKTTSQTTVAASIYSGTTAYAEFWAFWKFDCSSIPQTATITSVSCSARVKKQNTNVTACQTRLYCGTTAKGTVKSTTSTATNGAVYALDCGTWTRQELDTCYIRVYGKKNSNTSNQWVKLYGAQLTVEYTFEGYTYEISFVNNTSTNMTSDPSTTQYVDEDHALDIVFSGEDSTYDVIIKDNNVDIENIIAKHPTQIQFNINPSSLDTTNSHPKTAYSSYAIANGYTNETSKNLARFTALTTENDETEIYYNFNCSSIPSNAIIDSVTCDFKAGISYNQYLSDYYAQLCCGTTRKGSPVSLIYFTMAGAEPQTITDGGSWTRNELSTIKICIHATRGNNATAAYVNFYGATLHVNYHLDILPAYSTNYWTYRLEELDSDHVITIDDYNGPYYNITTSSTYSGASFSESTLNVKQGSNHKIGISVKDINEIIVKDNGTDVTSSVVQESSGYSYTVTNIQATKVITIEERTQKTVTVSSDYSGATAEIDPDVVHTGQDGNVLIDVANLYEIVVKDNNVTVDNSTIINPIAEQTATFIPSSFIQSESSYAYESKTYTIGNGLTDKDSTTYAQFVLTTTASSTSKMVYKFNCSSIPRNAIITSVSCNAKVRLYKTFTTSKTIQIYNGNTAKGTSSTLPTSVTNLTLNCGNWTRDELDDIKLVINTVRNTNTGENYVYFYGATLTVKYKIPAIYTIPDVQETHAVTITEAPYSMISVSATHSEPSVTLTANPLKVYNGRNSLITVNAGHLYEVIVKDNNTDITNNFVSSGTDTFTYTISNVQTDHSLVLTEAPFSIITSSSNHSGLSVTPASIKIYHSQGTAVFEFRGNLDRCTIKDNNTDITSSLVEQVEYSNSDSDSESEAEIYWTYTLNNINTTHNIVVYADIQYMKLNGEYKEVHKYFKKENGVWVEITLEQFTEYTANKVKIYNNN